MIRFTLFGVPVAVRPSFWIVAGLLGYTLERPQLIAIWIAIVFVSVLVHELGHALVARRFGAEVAVTLTTLGGLTSWQAPAGKVTPGRRAAVAAAGSATGIVFGLVVLGLYLLIRPTGPLIASVVNMIVWVNVGWGILNWLPIRPLDGGHLVTSLLEAVAPRRAEKIANAIFMLTSIAALLVALRFRLVFVAVLAGFMAWSEVTRSFGSVSPAGQSSGFPAEFSYDDPPDEPPPDPRELSPGVEDEPDEERSVEGH